MASKASWVENGDPTHRRRTQGPTWSIIIGAAVGLFCLVRLFHLSSLVSVPHDDPQTPSDSPYGQFPRPEDPFLFMPCTNDTLPPALDDPNPRRTWAGRFDPNPDHWIWGNATSAGDVSTDEDPYAGRGIYLCGYLEVPLDYANASDHRIVRLATSMFQVSGLARVDGTSPSSAGQKSWRTIVYNPGGPGGSGTALLRTRAEQTSQRLSDGAFDFLSWDPRGVGASQPAVSCFPYDSSRDRWTLYSKQHRKASAEPWSQLQIADVMNEATMRACWRMHGDLPRFLSTALVARDLEQIRLTLGEDELTAYLVSYGTGIGQTYANMFPSSIGRVILDGTEYVRDHRQLGGFGWTALDNVTDAWHDGFLGECINAGPNHCALAKPVDRDNVTLESLEKRMESLVSSLIERPMKGYTDANGPSLITHSAMVDVIYASLYDAKTWPALAQMLSELENGNTTLAAGFLDKEWSHDPTLSSPSRSEPLSVELGMLVICADAYDAPQPSDGLEWWDSLWANMTRDSWIAGNSRFDNVFPCRHFTKYWPEPAEVYRGDLDHKLRNPVLLIAETYDPATPLRNGRRLAREMGENARLIAHHGYGHASKDTSNCTDSVAKRYILEGTLPEEGETACYADEKPYLYGVRDGAEREGWDPVQVWSEHFLELDGPGARPLPTL